MGTKINLIKNMIFFLIFSTIVMSCDLLNNNEGETDNSETNAITYPYDFGDAPDLYSTLLSNDGARHLVNQSLYLGISVDGEEDGIPSEAADGDIDDGVVIPSSITRGSTATFSMIVHSSVSPAYLNGWIDFNGDDDWEDPNEQVMTDQVVAAGTLLQTVSIPVSAALGATHMRIRLSSITDVPSTGDGGIGEVEDYSIEIEF